MNLRKDHYRDTITTLGYARVALAPANLTQHYSLSSEHYNIKTFNNGSLGSGIDEERSEMR